MSGSMADIQFPTAEITRGNKKRRRRKKQDKNIYGLPYYIAIRTDVNGATHCSAPGLRSPMVDEERMRPMGDSVWLSSVV